MFYSYQRTDAQRKRDMNRIWLLNDILIRKLGADRRFVFKRTFFCIKVLNVHASRCLAIVCYRSYTSWVFGFTRGENDFLILVFQRSVVIHSDNSRFARWDAPPMSVERNDRGERDLIFDLKCWANHVFPLGIWHKQGLWHARVPIDELKKHFWSGLALLGWWERGTWKYLCGKYKFNYVSISVSNWYSDSPRSDQQVLEISTCL